MWASSPRLKLVGFWTTHSPRQCSDGETKLDNSTKEVRLGPEHGVFTRRVENKQTCIWMQLTRQADLKGISPSSLNTALQYSRSPHDYPELSEGWAGESDCA